MSDQPAPESTPAIQPAPRARSATFTRRFRAYVIDTACIAGLWIVLFFLGDAASDIPGATQVAWLLMFAAYLLYDPILVSRRGATVGHAAAQLRVVDVRTGRWPSFARAFGRSLVKSTLAMISFFTIELSDRHEAVHDMVTHTTVQVAASVEQVDSVIEPGDEPDVVLPSRMRRAAVIALYLVAVFIMYDVSITHVDAGGCLRGQG
ncbi:MAG: RDD family protein, partial [Bradyrhizobium sp.]|nr:RDD family protein [Bradyrhizobium sp.]